MDARFSQSPAPTPPSRPARSGRRVAWPAPYLFALAIAGAQAQAPVTVEQVVAAVDRGDFRGAETAIDVARARADLPADQRQALAFERERMRRIRLDFTLDRAAALAQLRKAVPDLRDAEFDAWDKAGLIERMDIDGQPRYFKRSISNLFRLSAEAAARRAPPVKPFSEGPNEQLNPHHAEILAAARDGATSVAPRRLRVTQSLVVDADAVPAGETVRAWIPYPRAIAGQQEDIRLLGTVPAGGQVAPEGALQRTAYMERTALAGKPTAFSVSYELTVYGRHFAIDPQWVQATPDDPALAPYLREQAPHIVFTPALRAFSREVVGNETHPYRIARRLFEAVDRIPGPARASTRPSPTSATTRCTPATPTAASRPCC